MSSQHHDPKKTISLDEQCKVINGLYLVATPIGNLRDISLRALEVLHNCTLIACEDTRVTKKLLDFYNIKTSLISYHEHNAAKVRPQIIEKINQGDSIALVSDAGMPLISDPGYKLVQTCVEESVFVTCLPGASAVLTALSLSSLPPLPFLFGGFLPEKKGLRQKKLEELNHIQSTLVFFESPKRLKSTLEDILSVLGNRSVAIARELTKLYETIVRGTTQDLIDNFDNITLKGEFVIVIGPPEQASSFQEEIHKLMPALLEHLPAKKVSSILSGVFDVSKNDLYKYALSLKDDSGKEKT